MGGHSGCWGWKVTRSWQGGGRGWRDREPTGKWLCLPSLTPQLPSFCQPSYVLCAVAGVWARLIGPSRGVNPSKVGGKGLCLS